MPDAPPSPSRSQAESAQPEEDPPPDLKPLHAQLTSPDHEEVIKGLNEVLALDFKQAKVAGAFVEAECLLPVLRLLQRPVSPPPPDPADPAEPPKPEMELFQVRTTSLHTRAWAECRGVHNAKPIRGAGFPLPWADKGASRRSRHRAAMGLWACHTTRSCAGHARGQATQQGLSHE